MAGSQTDALAGIRSQAQSAFLSKNFEQASELYGSAVALAGTPELRVELANKRLGCLMQLKKWAAEPSRRCMRCDGLAACSMMGCPATACLLPRFKDVIKEANALMEREPNSTATLKLRAKALEAQVS